MIQIQFACGHDGAISESAMARPVCHCGNTQIAVVKTSRPPRFTGTCTGPHAEYKALDPGVVNVAPAGPLPPFKETSDARTH